MGHVSSISMTLTEPCFPPDRPPHNYPNPTFSLIVASSFDKHVIIGRTDIATCAEKRKRLRVRVLTQIDDVNHPVDDVLVPTP